jgi:hypothetical protein
MVCKTCKTNSSVIDSRLLNNVRYRRRKCACPDFWFTKEVKTERPSPKPVKEDITIAEPLLVNGIPVTKKSPDWLKQIALKLHN